MREWVEAVRSDVDMVVKAKARTKSKFPIERSTSRSRLGVSFEVYDDIRMEAAAVANHRIQLKYSKERKVGEGTYAVVYLGESSKSQGPAAS